MNKFFFIVECGFLILFFQACSGSVGTLDDELDARLAAFEVAPLEPVENPGDAKVELGRMLFFDRELSGNRNISCATCHHPSTHSSDNLTLSIGQGGIGVGADRELGSGKFIARNSVDLFNRGYDEVFSMFTDMRVQKTENGDFETPAGDQTPSGLDHVLAAQALFPITDRDEMRGHEGDLDVNGNPNELADFEDEDFTGIWNAIVLRLKNIPEYVMLFNEAYPEIQTDDLSITHVANAIAAFESREFNFINSPFDQYLNGNKEALSDDEKKGGILFYGKANCAACHPGSLMFDQDIDNVLIPNLGPGKGEEAPLDLGISRISGLTEDNFAFRSYPLRNIELTAPYMHNGVFSTLGAVVSHYNDIEHSFSVFNVAPVDDRLESSLTHDAETQSMMLETMSGDTPKLNLTEEEMLQLVAFLKSLTDPDARDLTGMIPSSVPSGLPIDSID